jgi:hypothetical protein
VVSGVGVSMDKVAEGLSEEIDTKLSQFGHNKNAQISESVSDLLNGGRFRNPNSPLAEIRRG